MDDCVILGGGVVGLSLAYELAGHGQRVRLLERGDFGQESSWAGAGILPPADRRPDAAPIEKLAALSIELHHEWKDALRRETGIDNGYRHTGALKLARDPATAESLRTTAEEYHRAGIAYQTLERGEIAKIDPALDQPSMPPILAANFLPDECQLRNPRHIKALIAGCLKRGVELVPSTPVERLEVTDGQIEGVRTEQGIVRGRNFCVTSGAWSRQLLEPLGIAPVMKPMRGQIVLVKTERPPTRILNDAPHYMVPRDDKLVLIGSTVEDVGFDKRTTVEAINRLLDFAIGLMPSMRDAGVERTWAGLRPGSIDGLPYLGRLPGYENAFIATGHFRWGIQLSCATAVVTRQLLLGQPTSVDISSFRVDRKAASASATKSGYDA